jgi:hypothetical protein
MAGKAVLELKNVAKTIRNVGSALAPRRTGNLRNALRQYNTPERMVKTDSNGDSTITFYVAPPAAKYGKYWNDPDVSKTVRKGKTKNIPQSINYGKKAYADPSVKDAIKKYTAAYAKAIAVDLKKAVRDLKI